jgi:hypothetical protein
MIMTRGGDMTDRRWSHINSNIGKAGHEDVNRSIVHT